MESNETLNGKNLNTRLNGNVLCFAHNVVPSHSLLLQETSPVPTTNVGTMALLN